MTALGKLQNYTVLLKYFKDDVINPDEIKQWLRFMIQELRSEEYAAETLEFLQVYNRKFSELVTEQILLYKDELRAKPEAGPKTYTAPEFYKRLHRGKAAFSVWKKNGWFPNAVKDGKSWVISEEDIQEFLEDRPNLKRIWEKTENS